MLHAFRCLRWRGPTALMAAGLIALQTLIAGLAMAQAATALGPGRADVAVICHGHGGGDHGTAPDPLHAPHLCCMACANGGPPAMPAVAPAAVQADSGGKPQSVTIPAAGPVLARRTVRDGPAQAPPTLG